MGCEAMTTERIKQAWLGYRNDVVPDGVGEIQVQECKRAFFGGSVSCAESVLKIINDPELTELGRVRRLTELLKELQGFLESVKAGTD